MARVERARARVPLGAPRHAPPLARRAQGAAGRPRATRLPLVVRVRLDSPGSSFGPRTGPGPGNRLGRADTRRGRERRRRARGRGPGRLPRCRPRRRPLRPRDPTRLVFSAADADASSTTYSAPGFEPDRETNHDTRIATVSFRFRDVLIRSRALERLVEAYARRPAASTVESALLLELFRATTMDDAVADALGDGLHRTAAAVAARDAEVQLRDEDFVGMLVAAAASVKLEGEAETLRVAKETLDAELERAAEDVARATTHARERSDDDGNPTMGIESRQRSGSNAAEVVADADGAASPTSRDVAAATSRGDVTHKNTS